MIQNRLSTMKNCLSLIAVSLLFTLYFPYYTTAQCTWNGTTGNWSDAAKWSCGHAPLAAENAVINAGTLTLDVAPTITDLTLTGGTITGTNNLTITGNLSMTNLPVLGNTGDVTVAGTFAWASGTIGSTDGTATGTVYITGLTTITTTGTKFFRKKTLNLNNGANYSGNGSFTFSHGSVLNIPAMKSFNANTSLSVTWISNSGGGTINNAGTFDKQGSGSLTCQAVFNNTGTTQTTGGSLNLTGGGTHNGAFSIAASTTLEFGGGTNDLSTSTISGTGLLEISAGTVTLPNNSSHGDVLASGGTANFSGANTMQNLTVGSGTVNLSGSLSVQNLTFSNAGSINGVCPVTVNGNLDMSGGGAFGNTGDVTVAGTFAWASGTIGSTDGTATGTVYITGLTTITTTGTKFFRKKTLNLNNGANYSGNGSFTFSHGSVLNIPAMKSFNANTSLSVTWISNSGGGTINNAGTFDKQGSGSLTCQANFDNSGTITGASTSTITFTGTFTNTGLISPGASPGVLNLNKSAAPGITVQNLAIELEGPSPGTGGYDQLNNTTGALNLNGGTLTVTLLNGYLPNVGTSFTIATGTSRTGTFGTLNLPVDNARWTVTYNATNVVLTVALNLPVELLDFQAKRMDRQVRLNWATATEHDNRGFGIERSSDGRDFENIAFVVGKGDSDVRVDYTFDDPTPLAAQVIYYRLRQEDNDGKMEYSPVRSVEGIYQTMAAIWPNPLVGEAVLSFDLSAESAVTASVTDMQGRVLRQVFTSDLPKGEQRIELPEMALPSGQYLLRLQIGQAVQFIPFLKQ